MLSTMFRTLAGKWLPETTAAKANGFKSEVRALREMFNKLLVQLSTGGMPGVITTQVVNSVGTSAATAWKSAAGVGVFKGVVKAITAAETALTATGHDVAQNKQAWYALSVQEDGTTKTITKAADQTIATDVFPKTPANELAIGYMKIVTNAAAGAFDATTDDIAVGTHIASVTWYNIPALASINVV